MTKWQQPMFSLIFLKNLWKMVTEEFKWDSWSDVYIRTVCNICWYCSLCFPLRAREVYLSSYEMLFNIMIF